MTFQPYPTRSGFIFLGVAIILGAAAIFLATLFSQQSDLPGFFELLSGLLVVTALTLLALYWAMLVFRFHYRLNRNGLTIQWGLTQQCIPFESIAEIIPGQDLLPLQFKGLNMAGLRFGRGESAEYGSIKFYTTAPLAGSLLIVTARQAYLISPRRPGNFIRAWQARRIIGPTQHWAAGTQPDWPLNIPLLADPLTWWLLGLAALACLALFGYLSLILPQLPPALPIHFNRLGQPDRIADKSTLLMLPAAGAAALMLNALWGSLIYRREKTGAYLLWATAVALQFCLWVAVLTLT